MKQLKHHAMHIAMCAPMIVIAAVLLASGRGAGVLVPLAGCMLMMAVMMRGMGASGGQGHDTNGS